MKSDQLIYLTHDFFKGRSVVGLNGEVGSDENGVFIERVRVISIVLIGEFP